MKQYELMESANGENKPHTGLIFDIQSYAIHDGPGVRTLVFLKGCPLRCWWCHNPEGRSTSINLMFFDSLCIKSRNCIRACSEKAIYIDDNGKTAIDRKKCTECGDCTDSCPSSALKIIGREIGLDDLIGEIEKYNNIYSDPEGGVTFTGGEPLAQPAFLHEALKACKERYINTAVETSGYAPRRTIELILPLVDLFLFDIKVYDDGDSLKYVGVPSKIIRDNLKYILSKGKNTVLRFPIIPGITDTDSNVDKWVEFVSGVSGLKEIDLLPFHDVEEKYYRLGLEYKMTVHGAPSSEKLESIKKKFEKVGLKVKIGG